VAVLYVYSSVSKSKLCVLDPFHSAGICLATGACTSWLTRINAESGRSPLCFQRDLLPCSYAASLAAHPHHLSHSEVFCPNICYRYEMDLRASQLVGICFQQI